MQTENREKTTKAQRPNEGREMFDRIVLASQSPRRRELLAQLGLSFELMPAVGAEFSSKKDPGAYVEELAAAKAREIEGRLERESGNTDCKMQAERGTQKESLTFAEDEQPKREKTGGGTLIIGADTVVVKNGEILGKPEDEEDARRMLTLLSGTAHQVCTGLCLIWILEDQRIERCFHETTHVNFAELKDWEIDDYIATKDPMDKAGAYGIQSGAARFVTGIQGDYSNVVGLPVSRLYRELKKIKEDLERTDAGEREDRESREQGTAADSEEGEDRQKESRNVKSRLDLQFDFLRELDQEKSIFRQNYIGHHLRRENDAEHAWHMAIMAAVLREYANEDVDLERVLLMILLHDVVEIDAGDTYAYDEEGKKSQNKRELDAAERIFHILPPDQEKYFRGLWDEFEAWESPEAKFARACDNFQPMMLNRMNDSQSWLDHGICLSQVLGRNARSGEGARAVWDYAYEHFIVPGLAEGKLRDDREDR